MSEPKVFTERTATAKVVADSTYKKSRLVSVEVEFPRPYLAEFNTHRIFTRNSASSRAIPVWKRLRMCLERPYVPASFGKNQGGMQAGESLGAADQQNTASNWLLGRDISAMQAYCLAGGRKQILAAAKNHPDAIELCDRVEDGLMKEYPEISRRLVTLEEALHKQHANRPLELYSFHTVIVTSSNWRNFMGLRVSKMAQPEAQDFGIAIARAIMNSQTTELEVGQWHLPYVRQVPLSDLKLGCLAIHNRARDSDAKILRLRLRHFAYAQSHEVAPVRRSNDNRMEAVKFERPVGMLFVQGLFKRNESTADFRIFLH
jgi:hypothetical protein